MSTENPASDNSSQQSVQVDETKMWQLIAWVLGIIGAIIAYVAGPKDDPKVKHWIRNSIALTIIWIIGVVIQVIPILGIIGWLIVLGVVIIWIIGILKILNGELWEPPVVSSIASKIDI